PSPVAAGPASLALVPARAGVGSFSLHDALPIFGPAATPIDRDLPLVGVGDRRQTRPSALRRGEARTILGDARQARRDRIHRRAGIDRAHLRAPRSLEALTLAGGHEHTELFPCRA